MITVSLCQMASIFVIYKYKQMLMSTLWKQQLRSTALLGDDTHLFYVSCASWENKDVVFWPHKRKLFVTDIKVLKALPRTNLCTGCASIYWVRQHIYNRRCWKKRNVVKGNQQWLSTLYILKQRYSVWGNCWLYLFNGTESVWRVLIFLYKFTFAKIWQHQDHLLRQNDWPHSVSYK